MIDVIVPVYGGVEQTQRCIESVLASCSHAEAEIVVVDDAAPDPAISRYLDARAADGRITLFRNERNMGFVHSVNRGMRAHEERDVVLLNSDTEVASEWLQRLSSAARRDATIATATPFSNNATICSYPYWGWEGGVPGTLGLAKLDSIFARVNRNLAVDIPTAVGFCMYIRRDALRTLGFFDAERYGRGYGEENDFCMRAMKAGMRNVLAGDVFVYHEGGVSFSGETAALTKAATETLLAAHPEYTAKVAEFIESDPAQPLRTAIDLARIDASPVEAQTVLRERLEERARLRHIARECEASARQSQAQNAQLHEALARATALVVERDTKLADIDRATRGEMERLGREIEKLRQGLAYAESLAFGRQKELQEIHARPGWSIFDRLTRRGPRD